MSEGPPRRLIEEMITRWDLTRERTLIVEGPADQRVLHLVQREGYCDPSLVSLAVWPADAIDIPAALVRKHDITGSGAKQRVVAFAREVEELDAVDGFRGIVDKDLDEFVPVDYQSPALLYTDHACMDAYFWTPEVLRRLLIQFKCDDRCGSIGSVRRLYASIGVSCAAVSSVRIAALRHPEWAIVLHQSDRALSVVGDELRVDLVKYVSQCSHRKGFLHALQAETRGVHREIERMNPLSLINGHDLVWLAVFAMRALTSSSRRSIDVENVKGALVAHGTMNAILPRQPLFASLVTWAAA